MEYNPYVSKGKPTVSVRFIIKIYAILSIHICGCWQIKSDLRKFPYLKKTAYVRKSLRIDRTLAETFGLEIAFRRQYICILYDDKARPAYFMSVQHNDIEATGYVKGLWVYMSSLTLHSPPTRSKLKWWKLCRRKLPTHKTSECLQDFYQIIWYIVIQYE